MKYEQSDGQLRVQDLGETFVYSEQRVQVQRTSKYKSP